MTTRDSSILGTRVARSEDAHLVTGRGTFVDGLRLPELEHSAHVAFVRSTQAHAIVLDVELDDARRQPGVVAAFSAHDLGLDFLPTCVDTIDARMGRPLLAVDRVRFAGEPVAVVVAETREQAVDALEFVDVDYEPLPAAVTVHDAATDAVLLFPEVGTNTVCTIGTPPAHSADGDGAAPPGPERVPEPFTNCEVVVRQAVVNQRVAPVPLEPRAAAAAAVDGQLTLWLSTQTPHRARDEAADALGVAHEQVRVVAPDVGGGFGAKIGIYPEEILVGWLARRLGRPVRWVETRTESMQSLGHGRAQHQVVTIGGRRDGTIEAYHLEILQDAGAYPHWGSYLPHSTDEMASGVYDIPSVTCASRSVVTNTMSTVAYRGAGRPEATAAIERAVDLFAAEIGMDPADVRRRNLVAAAAFPWKSPTGITYDSGAYGEALERLLDGAGYRELRERQRERRASGGARQLGIGLSVYVEITAGYIVSEEGRVVVRPDGSVEAYTGTSPQGQGHATSWAMLVSDTTGVPFDRVRVVSGDTAVVASGDGTYGSRSLQLGGVAIRAAAEEAVEQARRLAAEHLESAVGDVVLDRAAGRFHVQGDPAAGLTWAQVAALGDGDAGLVATAEYEATGPTFPFGAHLAVVEVDVETGHVEVVRFVAVDDAGTLVNPLIAEGQRHGGIAQGIGQALYEAVAYDAGGNPVTSNLADYAIPSAVEMPPMELLTMETPTPVNPLGAKGIGEAGAIGAPPAVQNAVVDALAHLGVRHVDMPITPLTVWRALTPR